jgi:hypothetical protein
MRSAARLQRLRRHLRRGSASSAEGDFYAPHQTRPAAAQHETIQAAPAEWPVRPCETIFEPEQHAEAAAFFRSEGYAVVRNCLSAAELEHLEEFRVRTQALNPAREKTKGWWAGDDGNLNWSQPLLDNPELDHYAVQHPSSWQLVADFMGGEGNIRAYQFDFREAVAGSGKGGMSFHHDSVQGHRVQRDPYFPLDAMCTIHYLTDVTEETPAFAVVPRSNRAQTLGDVDAESATLVPIYAPRGSMVLYDNATWHTRLDGTAEPSLTRRTMHAYFVSREVQSPAAAPPPPPPLARLSLTLARW